MSRPDDIKITVPLPRTKAERDRAARLDAAYAVFAFLADRGFEELGREWLLGELERCGLWAAAC